MSANKRSIVRTSDAPQAIGPYSQAVKTDTLVFVSGQIALDPATGSLIDSDIRTETRQAMTNLGNILIAAGSSLDKVVKATLFIRNMDDFAMINEVYGEFFSTDPPARACVEVARLPKNAHVEVEAVALLNE
ncbi:MULTISPECIES: RidA family protein [Desulfococcus]|jgi:2-iminobutanoate/2-iminopropanoate deaminase|uniref:Endoribonuclease L-PSP n=1 Tax=Desulfococcus multivorans DSM 2059 TaxID=1121405 RepID=S7TQN4_DESML|nr:RidA family protein [Desulfococcus multivorans]AOY57537.1 RutC family protein [Desulfococcus multivorans]AQU99960.1 RidA family protein [Desulfococcus multivorans]EPR39286.1 endoribonuclease L-PSP [Desulfococcus multivorans DSM 2059]MDX9817467.1 RidA family protein [Desulfococcus multivorans]SKA12143.1 endoribonuclease L-PSP [Desulfococcus multivorans DSM 2059]